MPVKYYMVDGNLVSARAGESRLEHRPIGKAEAGEEIYGWQNIGGELKTQGKLKSFKFDAETNKDLQPNLHSIH